MTREREVTDRLGLTFISLPLKKQIYITHQKS